MLAAPCLAAEFSREVLIGVRLELVDSKRVEIYSFTKSGDAVAVIGEKDGALAGPVFRWQIMSGKLYVSGDGYLRIFTLEKEGKDTIAVRDEKGIECMFRRTKDRVN